MRREQMFGPVLTHWDEAAAYAVLGHLAAEGLILNIGLYAGLMKSIQLRSRIHTRP